MAGGTNKKKLFQVAKELNLGKETIKEFLEKKGIEVTGLNMRLEEDVYELVLSRFPVRKKKLIRFIGVEKNVIGMISPIRSIQNLKKMKQFYKQSQPKLKNLSWSRKLPLVWMLRKL